VNKGPDLVVKHVPGKDGKPFDRPASSPVDMPILRISLDAIQEKDVPGLTQPAKPGAMITGNTTVSTANNASTSGVEERSRNTCSNTAIEGAADGLFQPSQDCCRPFYDRE
jgi:hypothetical protein